MPAAQLWRFGPFEFDERTGELRRGGYPIKLQEQPARVLALLLQNKDDLVTREQLRAHLWPDDTFVDFEHSLNTAIKKLREALDDSPDRPNYIETRPRKGYRFIAAVSFDAAPGPGQIATNGVPAAESQTANSATPARENRHRWRRPLGFVAVLLILALSGLGVWKSGFLGGRERGEIHSIAVLPLENLSGDPSQEYFADGMTEELITDLAQVSSLRVISRTTAMQYKGTHKTLPQIARELNVDGIVEGSVMPRGGRVRITAQLIYAANDRHLWAESYEGELGDVLLLQNRVAGDITRAVNARLALPRQGTIARTRPVQPAAYDAYLRGRYFFDKRTGEALKKSVEYFRQAIAADPEFAPAYAGLAESLPALNWFTGKPPVDAMPQAMAAARRALELDETLGDAHTALGDLLCLYEWNWSEAEKELKRGLELNPSNSLAHERYAMYLQSMGQISEALVEARRAQELDPLSFFMNRELGRSLYLARRYDDAIRQLKRSEELEPNSRHVVWFWISLCYEAQGKQKEAIEYLQFQGTAKGTAGGQVSPQEIISLRQAYLAGGWTRYWTMRLQQRLADKRANVEPYFTAVNEARLGHVDKAWEWMEKSADQREVWVTWTKVDPQLDSMRSDPRYKHLLQRMHLND
jgi:TolB-like protein/DNA-binding winged helix-turn-helix (wHTH) protein/Tfp pilus assembly protein PilF